MNDLDELMWRARGWQGNRVVEREVCGRLYSRYVVPGAYGPHPYTSLFSVRLPRIESCNSGIASAVSPR